VRRHDLKKKRTGWLSGGIISSEGVNDNPARIENPRPAMRRDGEFPILGEEKGAQRRRAGTYYKLCRIISNALRVAMKFYKMEHFVKQSVESGTYEKTAFVHTF